MTQPAPTTFTAEDFDLGPVPAEPAAETGADDDLWSEVNLRASAAPIIDPAVGEDNLWGSLADTSVLEEQPAAVPPREPLPEPRVAPERTAPAVAAAVPAAPPERPRLEPAPVASPAGPQAVDRAELERLVAARVDAAVRQALEQLVGGGARAAIEETVWQVVPELAESMIRAEIDRIKRGDSGG